jgi:hypothetical protein
MLDKVNYLYDKNSKSLILSIKKPMKINLLLAPSDQLFVSEQEPNHS